MKPNDAVLPVADPVIQEVRRHKQAIAEEFGFDVVALGRSLQERQAGDPRFPAKDFVGEGKKPAK